jgi:hypothetical protein
MTNAEIASLLQSIESQANDAIDKLIPLRQNSENGNKYKIGYIIKKFEVIVGACHRAQDKLEFRL